MSTSPSVTVFTRVPPDAGPPMPTLVRHEAVGSTVVGFAVGAAPAITDGHEVPCPVQVNSSDSALKA
jgi:hypothetical protein